MIYFPASLPVNILQNRGGFSFGINMFLQECFSYNITCGKLFSVFSTCMDFNASITLYQGITLVSKLYPSRCGYLTRSANGSPHRIHQERSAKRSPHRTDQKIHVASTFPLKTPEFMAAASINLKLNLLKNLNSSNTALFNLRFIFLLPISNEKQMKISLIPSWAQILRLFKWLHNFFSELINQ